jgi:nucleotide-binding universal stress UspA family protein
MTTPLCILLPVDGSPAALAAVQHALALAGHGLAARCVLVNVQPPPTLYEVVLAHDREVLDEVRAGAGTDLLAAAQSLLGAAGMAFDSDVVGGDPGQVIVEMVEAVGADLVLLGARGDGGSSAELGSVAQYVLQHATVPVTVVHSSPGEAESGSGPD